MKSLSIIIVSYNVKRYLEQCLNSIYAQQDVDLQQIEVFVVDNFSKDGTIGHLRRKFPAKRFPGLHLIANKRNVGFGRANNQALHKAKGAYILFLNPDTLLTEHTLHDALDEAARHDDLGAMGVKMLGSDGTFAPESRRGVPSPWTAFCKMSGLYHLAPKSRLFGRYYMQDLDKDQTAPIDIVSGAFMLIPHKVLDEVGSFDESFFMYGEDIDLSFRMLQNGRSNRYLPTPILHYKGESTHKNSFHYVHVFYEAMLIFFRKHYKHYTLALSLPIKAAILMSAALSLTTHQCRMLRRFLYPRAFHRNSRMLYLGHAVEAINQLAEEYGLDIDCLDADAQSLPGGHASTSQIRQSTYLHIVYDLHDFSIAQVLSHFENANPTHCHIGTFNPSNGTLITGSKVYTLSD